MNKNVFLTQLSHITFTTIKIQVRIKFCRAVVSLYIFLYLRCVHYYFCGVYIFVKT